MAAKLKGWRTIIFSFIVAFIGVADATNWADIVPDGPSKGLWLFGIGVAIAWLRIITTTPVGEDGADG